MRFVTYASPSGGDRAGVVVDDVIHGLERGVTILGMLDAGNLQDAGAGAMTAPHEVVPLVGTELRAPLEPRSIRDGLGFLQHLRNALGDPDRQVDPRYHQFPPFYFANVAAVTGPDDPIPIPPGCEWFDFELEVAAVIGREGANITLADAETHIAGYTIFCDWSARDLQRHESPLYLGPAKGKDSANSIGPMLVTADELAAHRSGKAFALGMSATVNGTRVGGGRWDAIDWGFDDMIVYASRGTRLRPGDVLGSGTVPTGCLAEHAALDPDTFRGWLQPGDEVVLAVELLGEQRHRIGASPSAPRLSSGY